MSRVRIEKRKPMTLAYIEHTGSYDALPFDKDIKRLYAWAREHHIRPGFHPVALYRDDPASTPPEKMRSEIAIPVRGNPIPEGGVLVETLPAMEVATIKHNGPTSEYGRTYAQLRAWTDEHGYEWAGPSMELYGKKPRASRGQVTVTAKILVPVRKKGSP